MNLTPTEYHELCHRKGLDPDTGRRPRPLCGKCAIQMGRTRDGYICLECGATQHGDIKAGKERGKGKVPPKGRMAKEQGAGGVRVKERDFQKAVIELAQLLKWKVAHFRAARVKRGGEEIYETPVAADGKGWPDLVLVRDDRIIFAELKSEKGRVSPEQRDWLTRLRAAGQEVYVFRPSDWDEIEELLT